MTLVVNLYAGPGAGKSTTAAKIFALLKDAGQNVELVSEYVKQWAWEKKTPIDYDQFYLFAKQAKSEYRLFDKVDIIITDAPVLLTCYYAQVFGSPDQAVLFRSMILQYLRMCADKGQTYKHYFLKRTKAYDPRGRFQDEAGAKQIDEDLKRYLSEVGIKPIEIEANANCAGEIVDQILAQRPPSSRLIPGTKVDPSISPDHFGG
jgi:hypothetical protein